MSTRAVLIAVCVVARDERADAAEALDLWARESTLALGVHERSATRAIGGVFDPMDTQPFMSAALGGLRAGMLAAGFHMGTRVNGRENDSLELSARSIELACKLADAAQDGQILVSSDLGTFLTIARTRVAAHLEAMRVRYPDGTSGDAYRARPAPVAAQPARAEAPRANVPPPSAPGTAPNTPPRPVDGLRRSELIERLGSVLMPHLGPIAPVMLRRLPSGRMSAREFIDAVLRDVPLAQYEPVKRVLEEEIRRLR